MDIQDALEILGQSIQCDDNEAHDALDYVSQFVSNALTESED